MRMRMHHAHITRQIQPAHNTGISQLHVNAQSEKTEHWQLRRGSPSIEVVGFLYRLSLCNDGSSHVTLGDDAGFDVSTEILVPRSATASFGRTARARLGR